VKNIDFSQCLQWFCDCFAILFFGQKNGDFAYLVVLFNIHAGFMSVFF